MGFEHWIMAHFWPVIIGSLLVLVAAHFGVVWLLRQGKQTE
jgi:ABC-type transport system involved in cytochrome c biogenesis permease subunit